MPSVMIIILFLENGCHHAQFQNDQNWRLPRHSRQRARSTQGHPLQQVRELMIIYQMYILLTMYA